MAIKIFGIIYITFFFTLGILLYFVVLQKEYKDYRLSRKLMGIALLLVSLVGILRIIVHPHFTNPYADIFILCGICYIFSFLSYQSFLYMIETSKDRRTNILKKAVFASPTIIVAVALGHIFPAYMKQASIATTIICILINFILLTRCLREYDKFMLLMNNYYGNYRNIRWVPFCLWSSFVVACFTVLSFFYEPLVLVAGGSSLFVYSFIAMKLMSIVPENIHTARESILHHEIIAVEPHSHHEMQPVATDTKPVVEEPVKDIDERTEKRNIKIRQLMDKWVETESYVTSGINIKDVATQMGTNSNYLSTYINNVLDTSFANWLNSLRVEKSKEYLLSPERLSIEECGVKVGYESLYNYSRWFKAITGTSPSDWRRKNL